MYVLAIEKDLASYRLWLAANGHQGGRFPGSIGTNQRNNFPSENIDRYPSKGLNSAVETIDLVKFEKWIRHQSFSIPFCVFIAKISPNYCRVLPHARRRPRSNLRSIVQYNDLI